MNCIDIVVDGGTLGGTVTNPKLIVVNLPGYPTISEFAFGQGDGHELLDKRPIISAGATDGGSTPDPTTTSTKPTASTNPGSCAGVVTWKASSLYNTDQRVAYGGHLWQAKWWMQNEIPGQQGVWTDLGGRANSEFCLH
ncbi:hypothetical protein K493DRAFT_304142 [Basidiobolus meristosporus CBS 931.73]|uniref:Chitin-binding type-3 domain-containing protein n=1 Tax=Basidiobolus meristosporus CBS 931.73 TaxID=1314790 RepID=A0A1Y1Y0T5_9FUNG|nr:hypothetical protein K493DRAFT_304142 [Basidiobolus meristosporus CBS 931.73]|eukprot:ORX91326.1 hypothetical protein K493DRAFT_304142 [Basidiobolus meristosporus CBS 931.73]